MKRKQMNLLKSLDECIYESMEILEQVRNKKLVVCFSGGKDSEVTKHLCKVSGLHFDSIYSVTTIDPPEVVKHIKVNHPDVIFKLPKKSFYDFIKKDKYMSPSIKRRWCCTELKELPLKEYDYKIEGIRAEESKKRQGRKIIDDKYRVVYPIYYWAEWHVWEYIEKNDLPYLSLYDEGWNRVGCIGCPFHSYREHLRDMKRWPHVYRKFKEAISLRENKDGTLIDPEKWLDQYIKKKGMVDL